MEVLEKAPKPGWSQNLVAKGEPLKGAFFWLSAFYVVYCARPEDWIPGLKYVPLAKISGIFALLGIIVSAGKSKRSLRDLPTEAKYLAAMIGFLFLAGALSPVWQGGAIFKTLDFSKVLIAWVLTYVVVTNFDRLQKIIFIQSASVVLISIVSIAKGRHTARLEGVIGGIYSNPNDLAFAIVLSFPFCMAFLLNSRRVLSKVLWLLSMLAMSFTLLLTASRGGFITLLGTGVVGLWHFGVKGKRMYLIGVAVFVAIVVGLTAGGRLKDRFLAISGGDLETGMEVSAHGSYEQRRYLMLKSVEAIEHYPLGIGFGNFPHYSGTWVQVHVAYLQITVEGGVGALIFYLLFFRRGLKNLKPVLRAKDNDKETELFSKALHCSLIGFLVGGIFAPEAYQYFPYFAVAYTSALLALTKDKQREQLSGEEMPDRSRFGRKGKIRAGELAPVR